MNLDWTKAFLQEIQTQYPDYEHVVVWDGAGFHPKDSSHETVPQGVHIINTACLQSGAQSHRKALGFNSGSNRQQTLAHNPETRPSPSASFERLVGSS